MTMSIEPISNLEEQDNPRTGKYKQWWMAHISPGKKQDQADRRGISRGLGYFLEILAIVIWSLFVGRAYLKMDPSIWPSGLEFPSAVQTHFIWLNLLKCGPCFFWNGFSQGGAPAFADLHGSMLHPLVIILTLLAGVLKGAKLGIVASLIMAGLAQWWLVKVMGLGTIPRLWSGLLAVAAGNLAATMDLGVFGVLLSEAACMLVLAPGIALGLTGKRRYAILLGIAIGLSLLAGQGYMQVGMFLGILPAFLIFLPGRQGNLRHLWKEYLLAAGLALLTAGVFLVPMAHFYSNVSKALDSQFGIAEPLRFIPLNLLIDSQNFYKTTALTPAPYANLYVTFLGWVPIFLAILAWRFIPKSQFRLLFFFITSIVLIYLTASADLLKILEKILPVVAGVRNPPQIAGLANPLILGLSAWGLDFILKIKLPKLGIIISDRSRIISGSILFTLLLAIPLIWSLREAYVFSQIWLISANSNPELPQQVSYLRTDTTEWVNIPFGVHGWMLLAINDNLKISNGIRTWSWKDRKDPPFNQEATLSTVDPSTPNLKVIDRVSYISHPENEYAFIQSGDQKISCRANAMGGNIDVSCPDSPGGQLTVYENNWTGWYAWMDQKPAALRNADWLSMNVPAGKHTFQFRYRPWDVWVGMFLSLVGIALSIVLWFRVKETKVLPSEI